MLTPGFVRGTKSACRNHLRGKSENGEIMKVAETTRGALLRNEQIAGEAPELHVACLLHEKGLRLLALQLRVLNYDNVRAEAGPVHGVQDRQLRALRVEAPKVHMRDAEWLQQGGKRPARDLRQ